MQQRLGGIWELFIPAWRWTVLQIRSAQNHEGHCYRKADPYGFSSNENTAPDGSVVVPAGNFPLDAIRPGLNSGTAVITR